MSKPNHNPLLIFVRGIPGSGKSHFTSALRDAIKNAPVTVIDPDYVDKTDSAYIEFTKTLESQGLDHSIYPFRWLRKCAIDAADKNAVIIWNQPFTNRGVFDRLIAYLREQVEVAYGHTLQVLIVEINTSPDIAWNRVKQRVVAGGHGPDKDTFDRRCAEYVSYADTYPVLELSGEDDSKQLVAQALAQIQSALR